MQDLHSVGLSVQKLFDKRLQAYSRDHAIDLSEREKVSVTVTHGPDSSVGPLEAVLKELDRRTVTAFSVRGDVTGYDREVLEVTMTWGRYTDRQAGVDLNVKTQDLGWANEVVATISAEIDKGRPKWGWMQDPLVRVMIGLFYPSRSLCWGPRS